METHSIFIFTSLMKLTILFVATCRSKFATSVAVLCKQTRKGKFYKEWLFALPLYHFLKGLSEPYQKPIIDPEKISFKQEQELDLDGFKHKAYDAVEGYIS